MWTPRCYTYADGNILVTQHQRMGTLLDLVNLTKNADKQIIEPIAIYLTAELLGMFFTESLITRDLICQVC